jgi:hypothetical protein
MRLDAQPWWTVADAAELDLLTHELVRVAWIHRERCGVCSQSRQTCDAFGGAIEALLEWRTGRILRSKATWLRARQTLAEEAA